MVRRWTSRGAAAYVKNITFDKDTGEITESEDRIIDIYPGLWKSVLQARSYFVSLVIARILEMLMERKYSIGQMPDSLNKAECTQIKQNYYSSITTTSL
jgi:hypothetical protein